MFEGFVYTLYCSWDDKVSVNDPKYDFKDIFSAFCIKPFEMGFPLIREEVCVKVSNAFENKAMECFGVEMVNTG